MKNQKNLELNVGMACNNRCIFCISGDVKSSRRRWLALERAKEEIRVFYDAGCRSIGLLGGEPTAYPHLVDCVRYARFLGYARVAVCTNGTKLSEPAFADSLIAAGVTRFTLSFHSHMPALEDRLTGLPGNFERKLKGLRRLLEHKAAGRLPDNVSLNPVLNRKTYLHLKEYIEFFRGEGIDDIRFNFIWPQARVEKDRTMIPTYREAMKEIVRAVLLNESRWKMDLSFGGIPPCMLRWSGVAFSPKAHEHIVTRYFDEGLLDLPTQVSTNGERFDWQERKRDRLKTRGPSCSSCRYERRCEGIWKSYVELWGLDDVEAVL